jgi:transcriptional regulator with XRE-family HTH domain
MRRTDAQVRTTTPSLDVDHFADIRELEVLRQLLRRDLRKHTSQRTLASEIGIDRTVLRKFVSGQSVPSRMALESIREWAQDRPELSIPMAQVGLALLVSDFRPPARPGARKQIANALAEYLRASGDGPTAWVRDELAGDLTSIERESSSAAEVKLAQIRQILDDYASVPPSVEALE